jgi:heptosyltransferase-2
MRHVLVIRLSSLGDIILTEPVTRILKEEWSDAKIVYLTKSAFGPLVEMFPYVDKRLLLDDNTGMSGVRAALRHEKFDLVVDLHHNIRSWRIRRALRAQTVVVNKQWWRRFAAVRLRKWSQRPDHAVARYLNSIRPLGISTRLSPPSLQLPESYKSWWTEFREEVGLQNDYYLLAPGAAHATKAAPASHWLNLIQSLRDSFCADPVVVGSPEERQQLLKLSASCGIRESSVLTRQDIREAAAAVAAAGFVVSNDSGLAHLAAALDVPTLALFGPTHPVLGFSPLGRRADYYTVNEYCSPCSLHGKRPCYRDQRYCFSRMEATVILDKLRQLIAR